ncbi:hypothetical protein caldi_27280 [Caldinitratiruptor microaerophilus]|uniref:Uncharacterized protein n=1 Tax=Caldinitratiruptor microaerophilus TaxID=671077 RepID=A0AA35G9M7_9FIRM|nr:hypothetical protein caldi_27280 [Caldinitratiruptor microaerophilus]
MLPEPLQIHALPQPPARPPSAAVSDPGAGVPGIPVHPISYNEALPPRVRSPRARTKRKVYAGIASMWLPA